ncbi:alpha/beta hydrolase fold domain-containing protein [Actinomadura sp. LD22]|uniref:Alpha/beta hydrolase fold domain-containing protein n=1 Tax=Actinomadura physcomitrii TaxID=2650748 RepID=A0A6I4MWG0_9ACTN|nr:alpha/beta hydrolase [Actinomadura physcomitrii]MWA07009.1 alpha/beta hydrolase fold domain-containing protein [Actinomadura physcomitrii]
MALDEATQAFLKQMAEAGGKPLHERTPGEARAMGAALGELAGKGPEMWRVAEHSLGEPGARFLARELVPVAAPEGIIVYFHGGGWVTGHIDQFDTLARRLAERTRCTVVLVNYRKAPEHPYPAAVVDAWEAVRWAAAGSGGGDGRALPVIVAGDSAGGNLAAVVALRARDAGGPPIALQVLVYPVTDADLNTPSYTDPANALLLTREGMNWYFDHYAAVSERSRPDISPLRAEDLSGLPPAVLLLAEHDVLRTEQDAYGAALARAGVETEVEVVPGQTHGFFSMVNILPGQETGLAFVSARIRDRLSCTAPAAEAKKGKSSADFC